MHVFGVVLNVPVVRSSGTIYILSDGTIDPATETFQRDGDLYFFTGIIYDEIVVERSNIIIEGNGYTLQGSGSGNGLFLSGTRNVTVRNMNIKGFWNGVYLHSTSSSVISKSSVVNNAWGILLSFCLNNNISRNNITNNINSGIALDSSSNNRISENNITNSSYGITLLLSSNNFIYHNLFVFNSYQAYVAGLNSTWDDAYPSGGNYWSDYNGSDLFSGPYQNETGSDGIGDLPYVVDAYNRDRYPLMYQGPDINAPTTIDYYDGFWHPEDFAITLTATDDKSGVRTTHYRINDGPNKTVSIDGQPRITTEGADNKLEYWSLDNVGNEELPHRILTGIKLDKTTPVAYAGQNQTVNVGATMSFDASGSTDNFGIASYEWDFGDGTTAKGKATSHAYEDSENYTVTLTVEDAAGNSATHLITVRVLYVEALPIWIIGTAVATIVMAAVGITIYFLKIRKH